MSKQRRQSRRLRKSLLSFTGIIVLGIGLASAAQADTPLFFENETAFCTYYAALKAHPAKPPADAFRTHQKKPDGTPYKKGDTYTVYAPSDRADAVDISEASRDSEIESDIKALIGKILNIPAAPVARAAENCGDHNPSELKPWSKTLQYSRSTLTLTASKRPTTTDVSSAAVDATSEANKKIERTATAEANAAGAAGSPPALAAANATRAKLQPATVAAAAASATAAATASDVGKATVLIGPDEHWFLAVDLPVTKLKTLKYDSSSGGSLQPTESSPQFYISLDYQFGDILEPPTTWYDPHRIVLKAMLNASSKPLDSLGAAIGYTFPKWGFGGAELSSLSIFVGRFWTKQDAIVNGKAVIDSSYAQTWRVGISYNFSSALSKVKF
jgi:hypothetical protein